MMPPCGDHAPLCHQRSPRSFDPSNRVRAQTFSGRCLTISDAVALSVREALTQRGHQVVAKATPIAVPVMPDAASGIYYAAGDPATGRHAAGLE